MAYSLIILVAQALIMLFELRALVQSSSVSYYHPLAQAVARLTDPVIKFMPFRQKHIRGFFYAGFIVALLIALLFWLLFALYLGSGNLLATVPLLGVLMTVKTFGYMLIILLLVQALTSWLPATRNISQLCYELTYPIVSPVQKIIPPIGMIDISLMVVLIIIYALNFVFFKIFGTIWMLI